MVKIDGNKLQEVKDHYLKMAENEILGLKDEPTDEQIATINKRYQIECERTITGIVNAGPEKIFKNGFAVDPNGWRAGYTKKTIQQRTAPRRARNKRAKQARKQTRLQNK